MPMTSKFGADFVEFYEASAKATAQLDTMAAASGKVDTSVGTMAKSMDGAATTVTAGMVSMNTSSTKTTNSFTQLATQLQTADKSLNAFGVSVGPAVNVLQEMGQVSGQTMTSLGALGTATAALAVGVAAFKATNFILEVTGMAEALDKYNQEYFKYKTDAQTAGATADLLAKASALAKRPITDVGEALKITNQHLKESRDQFNSSANNVAAWELAIANVRKSGKYGELIADMKAGNLTVKEMEERYNISARAMDYLTRKTRDQKKAWEEALEPARKAEAQARQHAEAIQQLSDRMFGTGAIKAAQDYVVALGPMSNLSKMSADETLKLNTALGTAIETYTRIGTVAPQAMRDIYTATIALPGVTTGLGVEWTNVGEKVHVSIEKILGDLAKVKSQEEKNQEFYKQLDAEIDAAYKSAQDGANAATGATQQTTGAVNQLASAYRNVASTAAEYKTLAAGMEYDATYNARQGGTAAMMGMFQSQAAKNMRTQAGLLEQREAYVASATANVAWGRQGSVSTTTNLNVNVNNADAQGIANKLTTEMRHQGVRF
jgi:hypothetical protein